MPENAPPYARQRRAAQLLKDGNAPGRRTRLASSHASLRTTAQPAGAGQRLLYPPLVQSCARGAQAAQEQAAAAVASVSEDVANQKELIRAERSRRSCSCCASTARTRRCTRRTRSPHLAKENAPAQTQIATSGAIPMLLSLLTSGKAQMPAAGAIAQLAHANAKNQAAIAGLAASRRCCRC